MQSFISLKTVPENTETRRTWVDFFLSTFAKDWYFWWIQIFWTGKQRETIHNWCKYHIEIVCDKIMESSFIFFDRETISFKRTITISTIESIKVNLKKFESIIGIGSSVASCSAATIAGGAISGVACALSEGSMSIRSYYSSCQSKNDWTSTK